MNAPNPDYADWRHIEYNPAISEHIPHDLVPFLKPGNTALEIGCGTGSVCDFLTEQGLKVLGIDINDASITDAQRRQAGGAHFEVSDKGITKNEVLEVVRVADKSVVVRNAVGEERTLTAKQAKSFDVYEQRSIEAATGDRLLLTANRREDGFRATNGEIVTVAEVDRTGRICLEDGRTLPAGFRHFEHGYAVTAHRSQGKSVDAVIISGDGMRKELFYVAASRGRQSVQVVTSDKESLRESVARSSIRKSASELARKAGTVFVRGACRGIMAARHLAMRLSMRETVPVPAEINYLNEPRMERRRERGIGR